MKLLIARLRETEKETLGKLFIFDGIKVVFECCTLEPAWKGNRKNISCVPAGKYELAHRWSPKYADHLILLGVNGRSYVLMHKGNFYWDTEGCILVGRSHADINGDGELDVSSSRQTLFNLLAMLKDQESLTVNIVNV